MLICRYEWLVKNINILGLDDTDAVHYSSPPSAASDLLLQLQFSHYPILFFLLNKFHVSKTKIYIEDVSFLNINWFRCIFIDMLHSNQSLQILGRIWNMLFTVDYFLFVQKAINNNKCFHTSQVSSSCILITIPLMEAFSGRPVMEVVC